MIKIALVIVTLNIVAKKPRISINKAEILKLEIKREELELKASLAAVESKKIDLAKTLVEGGYKLEEIALFMSSV
jgi:hypothetical protein